MANEFSEDVSPKHVDVKTPAFEAYAALKADFDKASTCAQNMVSRTADQYGKVALPDSELDKLAVVWLDQQHKSLGRDITRDDLNAPQSSRFDTMMAERANNQFETIKHAQFNHEGGFLLIGSKEKDAITTGDIDKTLRKIEDQRQSMQYADALMKDGLNLFNKLAKVHDGEEAVTYWDLKDARKADDKARARGDKLFTDEERQSMDLLWDRWGHSHMRAIEQYPSDRGSHAGSNMPCDAKITLDSMAKGTGFNNADDMAAALSSRFAARPNVSVAQDTCFEADRQHQIIEQAKQMWRDQKQAIQDESYMTAKPGDGFDKLSRRQLTYENGNKPSEHEVVANSRAIAHLNGFDRETYNPKKKSIHPGQSVQIHDVDWQMEQMLQSIGNINDWVQKSIDKK
jgi:hypothetical protein